MAGEHEDTSVINKVEVFNEAYRLKEKGAILNWFDIEAPEGYYSLNDKISEIMKSPQGAQLFGMLMKSAMSGASAGGMADMMPAGDGLMQMMGGFTIVRLASMISMANVTITKEQLLALNAQLNKIPRV